MLFVVLLHLHRPAQSGLSETSIVACRNRIDWCMLEANSGTNAKIGQPVKGLAGTIAPSSSCQSREIHPQLLLHFGTQTQN